MSQLIILGNTNKYTFCNSIVAAQSKSKEIFGSSINEIYVIHSKESFEMLFQKEGDWLIYLRQYGLNEELFINRTILNFDKISIVINYLKNILNNCKFDSLIVDISNGTSEWKALLAIISYILDMSNVYFIDSISLLKKEKPNSFLNEEQLKNCYRKMFNGKEIDKLASLNFTEVVRYVEKINKLSSIYGFLDESLTNVDFFKNNLLHALKLKIQNDNEDLEDNTLYRISSSAISVSLEDLLDRFLLNYDICNIEDKTLGKKIHILQDVIREKASPDFDLKFFEKFNDFMLFLRNSTTHKSLDLSDSEKFKAALSMQMSLVFLEYYSTIIYNVLEEIEDKSVTYSITETLLDETEERYFGLDGDNTGQELESLLFRAKKESQLSEFSNRIKKAKNEVVNYIISNKGKIIFAEGDDILFKGKFCLNDLKSMKDIYFKHSKGVSCSIAYGKDFKEVLFSMKLAKLEKNTIKGISFTYEND